MMFMRLHTTLLTIVLVGLLAACGSATNARHGGVLNPSAPLAGAATPGSAQLNGCQTQPPATFTTLLPGRILTQSDASQGLSDSIGLMLHAGQVIEVRLAATIRWGVLMQPEGILRVEQPAGLYDPATQLCIWRITALAPGKVTLDFTGGPVCPPRSACPALAMISRFVIGVGA